MLYRVIDADKLSSLVRGFMNDYEVIAPVKRDQGYVFAVIHDPDEVEFDYTTTITSPKKFFLPFRRSAHALRCRGERGHRFRDRS